ncbi:MAG: MFS transporter [Cellvibrionaceae bacterium]
MLKNKLPILFLCQILYWTTVIVGVSLASLVGSLLAKNIAFATLPLAILTLGNIVSTLPLSLIMQRFGRRMGFSLGATACVIGGVICCYGIFVNSFNLFCFGNFLLGIAQASALYYRLAATDDTIPEKRGRAIAWVMSGGIVAAIIAPTLAIWSKDLWIAHLFLGSYVLVSALGLLTLFLCLLLPNKITPLQSTEKKTKENSRPLITLIRQPIFIAAISNTAISHAIMVLIMVSTPLAMLACNHSVSDATHVIQWHVLGMFIPSFFAGKLIDRYGASTISLWGVCILAISITIAISGITLWHFYSSLFLLGIGWNLMYTAGSTLTAASHRPEEKGRVQGMAELITSCLAAIAAFCSGALLHIFGWTEVNSGSLPLLIIAAIIIMWFKHHEKRSKDNELSEY